MVMSDGLTMYFSSDRPGGFGDLDIYVTKRNSRNDAWGEPVNLGETINSAASDHSVTISNDGHRIIYTSERESGFGAGDLFVSYREDITSDAQWSKSENMGDWINTEKLEACPFFHYENNTIKLYYMGFRESSIGEADLYYSVWDEINQKFQSPILLDKVSSIAWDMHFEPHAGLIWSNREGGIGKDDIWMASFDKNDQEWGNPKCLKGNVNTVHSEGMPTITHDFSELYFHSDRPGGQGSFDIYLAAKE